MKKLLPLLLACALPAQAQSLLNPGFEADTFAVRPGAVADNAALTGWTAANPARAGLNPAGGALDYANNGTVPEGTRVAWVQSDAAGPQELAQVLTDLTPGQAYTVAFRANAKTGSTARYRVAFDGSAAVEGEMTPVGGTAAYRWVTTVLPATATSHTLQVANFTGVSTNHVLLVDAFTVTPGVGGWTQFNWNQDANSGIGGGATYTHAYNFGPAGVVTNTTINGVLFTAAPGANPTVAGSFVTTGLSSVYGNATTQDNNAITAAAGDSANLMKHFLYGGNVQTLTLSGLTPGLRYTATLYSAGWENGWRTASFERGSDRRTFNQDQYGNDQGIALAHTYVAPASGSVTLSVNAHRAGTTFHLYGFSNREEGASPPTLLFSPRSRIAAPNSTSEFRVLAGSTQPLHYQWRREGVDLPGETLPTLSVGPVDAGSVAGYSVVVSNALGAVTSTVANLTLGPVSNPSFESDVFPNAPGYVSLNGPMIGWETSTPGQVGVNPVFEGTGPFLANGTIPDGTQAAYIQSTGAASTLSTVGGGLTPGQTYRLGFRMNSRTTNLPVLSVSIDGGIPVEMRLSPVGGTAAYHTGALDFTAASTTASLEFSSVSVTAPQDTASLLDAITLVPTTPTIAHHPWTDDLTSGFTSTARVTHAYTFNTAQNTVINDFPLRGVAGVNPAVAGKFSTSGFGNAVANDTNFVTDAGGGGTILARDFVHGGAVQQLVITGLVAGVEYEASLYSVAWDPKPYGRAVTVEAGGKIQTINQDHYDFDGGIRITARYTADETGRGVITLRPTHTASTFHLYGFMNQEVSSTQPPSFYQQPAPSEIWTGPGLPVRVNNALVGGDEPLTYAWWRDGAPVPGQTGRVLDLPTAVHADSGEYTLVVSNALGAVTSTPVRVEVGLPSLVNWSFEAEDYLNGNGYQDTNGGVITGWTFAPANIRLGLNPAAASPFANNGVIPHGAQVAFLQDDTTLTTSLTGLTAGEAYFVHFYANARAGYPSPTVQVEADDRIVLPSTGVTAGAYLGHSTAIFVATNTTARLTFRKGQGPVVGDSTLLLDAITLHVADVSPPTLVMEPPAEVWIPSGDPLVLNTLASGTPPLSYQWHYEGSPVIPGDAPSLDLSPAAIHQTGSYWLVVTNLYGAVTSRVSAVQVGYALRGLFSTGVDDLGAVRPGGSADLHYRLTASADPAFPGPGTVVLATAYPIPPYLANNSRSAWIAANPNPASVTNGLYVYETQFLLDEHDPAATRIDGHLAVDNRVLDVRLNGSSLGISANSFSAFAPFAITNGFQAGLNTLEFIVSNDTTPGPCALRVEMRGVGRPTSGVAARIIEDPSSREAQPGSTVRLVAGAEGSAALDYQWFFGATNALAGATQPWLNLLNVSEADQGDYTLRVSNGLGTDTSLPARLTVLGPLPIALTPGPGGLSVTWDATSEPWTLWQSPSLTPPVSWTPVEGTLITNGTFKVFTFPEPDSLRYFRLEKP
jgi:hypothetical protein